MTPCAIVPSSFFRKRLYTAENNPPWYVKMLLIFYWYFIESSLHCVHGFICPRHP